MHTLRATAERTRTATLLTTIEPTSALPTPPTARRLDHTRGFGIAFEGQTVLLGDDGVIEGGGPPCKHNLQRIGGPSGAAHGGGQLCLRGGTSRHPNPGPPDHAMTPAMREGRG